MAADWIPMRIDLRDDPAVITIAVATNLDPDAVAGKLLRLWGWANRQLRKGDAPVTLESWIDQFVGVLGFAKSMSEAGWLVTRYGKLTFPKFDRWNSQSAKKRALTAERMKRFRDAKRDAPVTQKVTPKGEKRRVQKKSVTRPRNAVFDTLAEITGTDPSIRSQAKLLGVKSAELSGAEPPYSPDDIREFARRFHELCSWAREERRERPTPGEVVNWIHLIRAKPVRPEGGEKFDAMQGHTPMNFDALRRKA